MKGLGFYIEGSTIYYACLEEKENEIDITDKGKCDIQKHGDSSKTMSWAEDWFNLIIAKNNPDRVSYLFSLNIGSESELMKVKLHGVLELVCYKMNIPVISKNKQSFSTKHSAFWKRIFWGQKATYNIIIDSKFGKRKTPWNMKVKLALACAWETLVQ